MMKATYVRVSAFEQNISRQLEGKEGEVYWDKVSGMVAFENREKAVRLLEDAAKDTTKVLSFKQKVSSRKC